MRDWKAFVAIADPEKLLLRLLDSLCLQMGIGGLLALVGLTVELLIAGSHAADGTGFPVVEGGL